MTEPLVTVVVPTYNGEEYLERLLESVERQRLDGEVELLVVDSGSVDRTLEIVSRHPDVRLIQIPNSEFGHGRTRGMAADTARGEFVAFLTQDAVPLGEDWLAELIAPFAVHPKVALVTGRQVPREHAFPLQRYEIIGVFAGLGPDDGVTLYGACAATLEGAARDRAAFHSDVNAAVRKSALADVPFRDVPYAEDQMMGRDVLEAGLWKAYAGRAVVEHSNDLTWREYGKRIYDETVGLRRLGMAIPPLSRIAQLRLVVRGVLGDSFRISRDTTLLGRARWMLVNPSFHVKKWSSYRRATRVSLDDMRVHRDRSLEASRRPRD